MSEIRSIAASPQMLYVFFRSLAELPAHLLVLAEECGLTRAQLERIRSLSMDDFRRLRQLCPVYFRAVGATAKLHGQRLDAVLNALEAATSQGLAEPAHPPGSDFITLRALLLYVNEVPEAGLEELLDAGLTRRQVQRIRQLPVSRLAELHKLPPELCTAVRIRISLIDEVLDRLLRGLSLDRYRDNLQTALLDAGAPAALMQQLFGWSVDQFERRRAGLLPPPAAEAVAAADQLRIWIAWEECADVPGPAERYLTVAQQTGLTVDAVWQVVNRRGPDASRALLGLLGQWRERRGQVDPQALLEGADKLDPRLAAALPALDHHQELPDFVDACLSLVQKLTGCASASFHVRQRGAGEDEDYVVMLATTPVGERLRQSSRVFPVKGSLSGAAMTRRRLCDGIVTRIPEINEGVAEAMLGDGKTHAMSVPLLNKRDAVGTMNLLNPHRLELDPELQTALLQLGRYIGRRLGSLEPQEISLSA